MINLFVLILLIVIFPEIVKSQEHSPEEAASIPSLPPVQHPRSDDVPQTKTSQRNPEQTVAAVDPTQLATRASLTYDFNEFDGGARHMIGLSGNFNAGAWNLQAYVPFGIFSKPGEPTARGMGDAMVGVLRTFNSEKWFSQLLGMQLVATPNLKSDLSAGSIRGAPYAGLSWAVVPALSFVTTLQYQFSFYTVADRTPVHQMMFRGITNLFFPLDFFAVIETRPLWNFASDSLGVTLNGAVGRVWSSHVSTSIGSTYPLDRATRDQLGTSFRASFSYTF